jgi:hypothetical protein
MLPLDAFGREAIEDYATTHGATPSAVVRDAALYYLADSDSGRPSWRVPRFMRKGGSGPAVDELEIELDDDTWTAIEQEARRQEVRPELLLRHAVLYFLASC